MNRRELLKMIAMATGGAVIGGEALLTGCASPQKPGSSAAFTDSDIAFLDEVAETILPKTQTPGAKEAGVGKYMTVAVDDCYTKEDQDTFHAGMAKLDEACSKMHHKTFMEASPEERTSLLKSVDEERKNYYKTKKPDDPNHYFQQMKQLAIFAFFTSEVGRKGALNYVPVPTRWDAIIDYKKGDKAYAGLN